MDEKLLQNLGRKHPQVLIAGGASYLGVALSKELLGKGFKVQVVDDFSSGESAGFKELGNHRLFRYRTADITKSLSRDLDTVDFIFHLVRLESHQREERDTALSSLLTNAWGTKNLLELTYKTKARFLLASTLDVYQSTYPVLSKISFGEASPEEEKLYSLSEAKRFAEALVWEYAKQFKINARIVRLADVYGPSVDLKDSGNLGLFLGQLLKGEDLVVYGEGLNKEYYLYLDDAVFGLLEGMFSTGTAGGIFPLAPSKATSVLELAYLVKNFASTRTKIAFNPGLSTLELPEIKIIDQSPKSFTWKPTVSLREGIALVLGELREQRALERLAEPTVSELKKLAPSVPRRPSVPLAKIFKERAQSLLECVALPRWGSLLTSWKWGMVLSLLAGFLLLVQPLVSSAVLESWGERSFNKAQTHFSSSNFAAAALEANHAATQFESSEGAFSPTLSFLNTVGCRRWSRQRSQALRVKRYFSKSLVLLSGAIAVLSEETITGDAITLSLGKVNQSQNLLLLGQAELGGLGGSWQEYLVQAKGDSIFLQGLLTSTEASTAVSVIHNELLKRGWRPL